MFKRSWPLFGAVMLVYGLVQCGGGNSGGSKSPAPEGESNSRNIALNLVTSRENNPAALVLNPSGKRTVTPSESYCDVAMENPVVGSETQSCLATPYNYNLGVLGIYLVECEDTSGNMVTCDDVNFDNVESRVTIYEGGQEDLQIDEFVSSFPAELEDVDTDATIGGVQIVTAYIQQKFPDSTTDADEADKILSVLQGVSYRICTTPHDQVDSTTMETRCGQADAEMGDYLIDLDDDGTFGFMVVSDASTVSETGTRPNPYNFHDTHFENQMVTFLNTGEEYTTTSWFDVEGYFAPIMPLSSTQDLTQSGNYRVTIEFDISETFKWTDGADSELADANTCVQSITDQTCASDSDSGSVGKYNPFYDTAFLPNVPDAGVTVEEVEDCRNDSSCIIRLVFFGPDSSFSGATTDTTTMYTAVSSDGTNFIEEGDIYTSTSYMATDPDLFKVSSSEYVLFVSHGGDLVKATAASATGTYSKDSSFSWSDGAVSSTAEIGGSFITFFSSAGFSSVASDAIGYATYDTASGSLTLEGTALSSPFSSGDLGGPSVIELADGSFLMFVIHEQGPTPDQHDIYKAISSASDGLTYSLDTSTGLIQSGASVPGAVRISSGGTDTIYLYVVDSSTNSVAVATSTDSGGTFDSFTPIEIFGLSNSTGLVYDPHPMVYE